jgi:hypothetical protein
MCLLSGIEYHVPYVLFQMLRETPYGFSLPKHSKHGTMCLLSGIEYHKVLCSFPSEFIKEWIYVCSFPKYTT